MSHPPLVLVHGLWDTPRLFHRLVETLDGRRDPLLITHLPHGLVHVPLATLTERLHTQIVDAFGPNEPIDLLGFSMGAIGPGLDPAAWRLPAHPSVSVRGQPSAGDPHCPADAQSLVGRDCRHEDRQPLYSPTG